MKIKHSKALRITLLALIICTLLFIFLNSMLPVEQSSEESEGFSEFLELFVPSDTPFGSFVHTNIRKIAHFAEFFMLGLFVSLYVSLFLPEIDSELRARAGFIVYSALAAPIVALIDETIQIFSGRGPGIVDVWIDTWGYVTAAAIVYGVCFIKHAVKKNKKEQK